MHRRWARVALVVAVAGLAACDDPGAAAHVVDGAPAVAASQFCAERDGSIPDAGSGSDAAPVSAPQDAAPAFPLTVDGPNRLLVDSAGTPFRIQGDAGWSMIAALRREEVEEYLTSRASNRFNTILVNLIENRFLTDPPANAYGVQPFTVAGDFTTPNAEYFDYADEVIERAGELGFVLLLAPAYIGYKDSDHGWYNDMKAAGVDVLYEYGRFVGERFGHHENIIWVNGGDDDPDQPELVDAIARGIRDTDPDALQTAHGAPGTPAAGFWGDYEWLDVDNVYEYYNPYGSTVFQYTENDQPLFLLESTYENEFEATTRLLRSQAYQAILGGAVSGQVFGNNPMWHFATGGLHGYEGTWQDALTSPGTISMRHHDEFFDSLPWWTLTPDLCDDFLRNASESEPAELTVAAVTADRTTGVVYNPTGEPVTLDVDYLSGDQPASRWFDPTSGEFSEAAGEPTDDGLVSYTPPGANADGDSDWVLIVER